MSDYNERACTRCGSLLHHEDDCPRTASAAMTSEKGETPGVAAVPTGLASPRRIRQMKVAVQHDRLSRASELAQIEAIALHYVAQFNVARDILEIVRRGERPTLNENASACVRMLAEQIRNNHAHDLGIELSWPNRQ